MRIAVVTPLFPTASEPYRGAPIRETIRALKRYGDLSLFYPHALFPRSRFLRPRRFLYDAPLPDQAIDGLEPAMIPYRTLPLVGRPVNGRLCAAKLHAHIERARPDVILAYWLYPEGYAALLAGERLGIPVVLGARGSDLRLLPARLTGRLVIEAARRAALLLTVSDELRDRAIASGCAPERVVTVRNGCDGSVYRVRPHEDARQALAVPGDAELVLFVGRLNAVKGPMYLLDAFARLAASRPALRLVFAGRGPEEARLRQHADSSRLLHRVSFLGDVRSSDVALWMSACDLVCLPSLSEGCPNVVLEALACGRPVVASNVGGVPEIVTPDCGILCAPGDPVRLAEGLNACLERGWDEAAMAGTHGRSWDDVARETYAACRVAGSTRLTRSAPDSARAAM